MVIRRSVAYNELHEYTEGIGIIMRMYCNIMSSKTTNKLNNQGCMLMLIRSAACNESHGYRECISSGIITCSSKSTS